MFLYPQGVDLEVYMFSIGSRFSTRQSISNIEALRLVEGDTLTFHGHKIQGESGIWQIMMPCYRDRVELDDEYLSSSFKSAFSGLSKGENGRWQITAADCEYDFMISLQI